MNDCNLTRGSLVDGFLCIMELHTNSSGKMELLESETIDFSSSFSTWLLAEQASYGRFNIEALLFAQGPTSEDNQEYVLCSSVMAADVYGMQKLIKEPTYEYTAVFSHTEYKIFRTYARHEQNQDTVEEVSKRFRDVKRHLHKRPARIIETPEDLIEQTLEPRPLVAHMTLLSEDPSWLFRLVFPVKHINIQAETRRFQVETGPILLPDRGHAFSQPIDRLSMAYTVFNRLDKAEFAIRQPTAIAMESANPASTRWYSRIETFAVQCQLVTFAD